ncbi:class I SAM-dependent methyltransferase [Methylocella tundrae]|uniref:Methyltransferase small n=1 Tax=Methylocella tundrae TaxID=227605 RepID=A0A4U8Z582_METTU|nr:methyltransferase [Methylocella tundrae]WPP04367.1 methyltransferase [Methylocella tundrae]VFU10715.1 Methyltransferase small [Methylocella tundrae]
MASDAAAPLSDVLPPRPGSERPSESEQCGVYGAPPVELASAPPRAIQFSPLVPGAAVLETQAPETLAGMTMLGPPGTVERRRALALALRALRQGALLTALAPKDKGGSRIAAELRAFGCVVDESSKRHHRVCVCGRPAVLKGIEDAIAEGALQRVEELGLWSQPGVFSWNRIDPGSALLAANLPALSGRGADLGCGVGYLSIAALAAPKLAEISLIDIDRRAIEAARRNIQDPRARFFWADARREDADLKDLDFIVMNPPFHDGGAEDQNLGKAFILRAAKMLRKGGALYLVANRHLPYEAALKPLFRHVAMKVETGAYKIFEAQK